MRDHNKLVTTRLRAAKVFQIAKSGVWLCVLLALAAVVRCHNRDQVFVGGRVYFVDADCYSRMTRVRMVLEHPAAIIRHHDFENWPQGVAAHTTMPMDWMIVAVKVIADCGLRIADFFGKRPAWEFDTVDLAGAIVSPLLGVLTVAFLWFWSRRERFGGVVPLLTAVSPILVHGTVLGRPDHQALLIFLLAVALGTEVALVRERREQVEQSRSGVAPLQRVESGKMPLLLWGLVSGAAWALALWVSLYEPLVLLLTVFAVQLIFFRRQFLARERWPGFAVFGAILVLALLIEGWHIQAPDAAVRQYFGAWAKTIGEMQPAPIFSPTLFRWVGLALLPAPALLALRVRAARDTVLLLALLAVCFGFTLSQQRWGYFFALVFAMSLPWALAVLRKGWIAWPLFVLSLWPLASEWDATLFPDEKKAALIEERRTDNVLLRDVAGRLKNAPRGGVIAPWWFSPALAYWSGQPCVAGSSHESLSGIVDTTRFYLIDAGSDDVERAREIAQKRRVRWVIVYDWTRVAHESAALLPASPPWLSLARVLDERPSSAPDFLNLRYANQAFKVFEIQSNVPP
jgi:hypothetical protein